MFPAGVVLLINPEKAGKGKVRDKTALPPSIFS